MHTTNQNSAQTVGDVRIFKNEKPHFSKDILHYKSAIEKMPGIISGSNSTTMATGIMNYRTKNGSQKIQKLEITVQLSQGKIHMSLRGYGISHSSDTVSGCNALWEEFQNRYDKIIERDENIKKD